MKMVSPNFSRFFIAVISIALPSLGLSQETQKPGAPGDEQAQAQAEAPVPVQDLGGTVTTDLPAGPTGEMIQDIKFYYSIGRHDRSLELINNAGQEVQQNPDVRFTKANILALGKDWEEAQGIYETLLDVWPTTETIGGVQTRFNLAEVYYVLGEFRKALELYNKLYAEREDRRGQTYEYLQFKIFLTNQLLGNTEKANQVYAQFDMFDMSPNYYYATAVKEVVAGDQEEGKEWVRSAWNIYDETINNAYTEALQESGLMGEMSTEDRVTTSSTR